MTASFGCSLGQRGIVLGVFVAGVLGCIKVSMLLFHRSVCWAVLARVLFVLLPISLICFIHFLSFLSFYNEFLLVRRDSASFKVIMISLYIFNHLFHFKINMAFKAFFYISTELWLISILMTFTIAVNLLKNVFFIYGQLHIIQVR